MSPSHNIPGPTYLKFCFDLQGEWVRWAVWGFVRVSRFREWKYDKNKDEEGGKSGEETYECCECSNEALG